MFSGGTLQLIDSDRNENIEKLFIHIRKCKRGVSAQRRKEIVPGSQPAIPGPA